MGSPADDLDAVLAVLKSRGLEADVVIVGPVTVQLRRTFAPPSGDALPARPTDEKAAFEEMLFRSARAPG